VIDFLLRDKWDEKAARAFFQKATGQHGIPEKVVIDGSHFNALALHHINVGLWNNEHMLSLIEILSIKYLNNIVEQSHRRVKGKMNQCLEIRRRSKGHTRWRGAVVDDYKWAVRQP